MTVMEVRTSLLIFVLSSTYGRYLRNQNVDVFPEQYNNDGLDSVNFGNETKSDPFQSGPFLESLNLSVGYAVKFYLYTQKNSNNFQQLWLGDHISLSSSHFDKSKKTIIVIHGYMSSVVTDTVQAIKNNILAVEDVNVIGIDWSLIADTLIYPIIAAETPVVGSYIGDFINFLADNGLVGDNLHLIGHSLGAHAAGVAAKNFKHGKVARISGLDPALPGYEYAEKKFRLDAQDAKFVDCIHTCANLLGMMKAICQADFYPNGGTNAQPGCSKIDLGVCSHGRSHEFFAESIEKGHIFRALTCPSIPSPKPVNCTDKGALMGYPASSKYLGLFYLQTNSAVPFAKIETNSD